MTPWEAVAVATHECRRQYDLEKLVLTEARSACTYARLVCRDRWPAAEDIVLKDPEWSREYIRFLRSQHYTPFDKWIWAKYEGVTDNLVEVLNHLRMGKEIQNYVCYHRPDLIGKIRHLDPKLKAKYSHELELSGVDL